jgi:hypothetical protein
MLELPHAIVGIAIAKAIPNPLIAIPLAVGSHFVLDMLPHWNPHFFTETQKFGKPTKKSTDFATVEIICAGIVSFALALTQWPDIGRVLFFYTAAIAGMSPDLVKIPFFFLKVRTGMLKKYVLFERSIQNDAEPPLGIITQVLVALVGLFVIFFS